MKSNFRKITSVFLVGMLLFLAVGAEFAHTNCFTSDGESTSIVEKSQDDASQPVGTLDILCLSCLFHSANAATLQSFELVDALLQNGIAGSSPTSPTFHTTTIHFSLRAPPAAIA